MKWLFLIFGILFLVRAIFMYALCMSTASDCKKLTIWQRYEKETAQKAFKVYAVEVVICVFVTWLMFYGYVISA